MENNQTNQSNAVCVFYEGGKKSCVVMLYETLSSYGTEEAPPTTKLSAIYLRFYSTLITLEKIWPV